MTAATEDRMHKLLNTLSIHSPNLDLSQIKNFLIDLSQQAEGDERNRCLSLLSVANRRIAEAKGRIWKSELDLLAKEVEAGHQTLFTV